MRFGKRILMFVHIMDVVNFIPMLFLKRQVGNVPFSDRRLISLINKAHLHAFKYPPV